MGIGGSREAIFSYQRVDGKRSLLYDSNKKQYIWKVDGKVSRETLVTVTYINKVDLNCRPTAVVASPAIYEYLGISPKLEPSGFTRVNPPPLFLKEDKMIWKTDMVNFVFNQDIPLAECVFNFKPEAIRTVLIESEDKVTPFNYTIWELNMKGDLNCPNFKGPFFDRRGVQFPKNWRLESW